MPERITKENISRGEPEYEYFIDQFSEHQQKEALRVFASLDNRAVSSLFHMKRLKSSKEHPWEMEYEPSNLIK